MQLKPDTLYPTMGDVVIGFDAANTTGWGVVTAEPKPRLVAYGTVTGSTDKMRKRKLLGLACDMDNTYAGQIRLAVVEGQHVAAGKDGRISAQSLRAIWKLRLIAGWMDMICTLYGWAIETPKANDWRRAEYGKELAKGKRETMKERAVWLVRAMWPQAGPIKHDAAEALMLARYGARKAILKKGGLR